MLSTGSELLMFLRISANKVSMIQCDGKDETILFDSDSSWSWPDGVGLDLTKYFKSKNKDDIVVWWTNMGKPDAKFQFYDKDACLVRANLFQGNAEVMKLQVPKQLKGQERNRIPAEQYTAGHDKPLVTTMKQLALSSDGAQVFFCDREGHGVKKYNSTTQELVPLLSADDIIGAPAGEVQRASVEDFDRFCVGIALDEAHNYIFTTLKGASHGGHGRLVASRYRFATNNVSKEEAASGAEGTIDPAEVKILRENLPEPVDVLVDDREHFLYWTDRGDRNVKGGNTVNRATLSYDSAGVPSLGETEILFDGFEDTVGITWAAEDDAVNPPRSEAEAAERRRFMYVTDIGGNIYKCDMVQRKKEIIRKGQKGDLATGIRYLKVL